MPRLLQLAALDSLHATPSTAELGESLRAETLRLDLLELLLLDSGAVLGASSGDAGLVRVVLIEASALYSVSRLTARGPTHLVVSAEDVVPPPEAG